MEQIFNTEFKEHIIAGIKREAEARGCANHAFFKEYGISEKIYLSMVKGHTENVMPDGNWFTLARKLGVTGKERKWNVARTDVFDMIEEDIVFCQENSKARICVDECGIGKTFAAKYISKSRKNCFYVDASQGKTISLFTRQLALALGLNANGRYYDVKEDIKLYLRMIDKPVVIIDEAGDLGQNALQEIKEFWNATEGFCGWYLMGADGLKYIIERGIKNRKPGFKEIFSRFSERYTTPVPMGKEQRLQFYKKLITDVLSANMVDKSQINDIVKRCLVSDKAGNISGLRRAESLLILYTRQAAEVEQTQN